MILEQMFGLHQSYWRERNQAGAFGAPELRKFLREATGGFAECGWLRLIALRVGGAVIGVLYAFADKGRVYYYQSGIDPGFKRVSAGTLLIGRLLEFAIWEGMDLVDFLRGAESYKYRWGARDRAMARMTFRH